MKYECLFYNSQTSTVGDPEVSSDIIKVCVKKPKFM